MALRSHPTFPSLRLMDHPLVAHKLSKLRDVNTSKKKFRELVYEITLLMAYEATAELPLGSEEVVTPLETTEAPVIVGKKPLIVPILRAGLGMVDAFQDLMPGARVGHLGMYRDEATLEPRTYYFKIPSDNEGRWTFVLDPMLATGGSAAAAVAVLKERGVSQLKFVCLLAAPEGVRRLSAAHPELPIITACLDRELNERGYILPGVGDAGDRLFGTR